MLVEVAYVDGDLNGPQERYVCLFTELCGIRDDLSAESSNDVGPVSLQHMDYAHRMRSPIFCLMQGLHDMKY